LVGVVNQDKYQKNIGRSHRCFLDQITKEKQMNRIENFTGGTASHSTRLPHDGNQVAGYNPLMWLMALLLAAVVAGCGDGSSAPNLGTSGSGSDSAKAITSYSIAWATGTPGSATGTIDQTLKTIKVTVPHATLLTPMTATFLHTGVVTVGSVIQVSGSTADTEGQHDFTLPVSYKVTAADGTWATYTALISRDPTVTSLAITPPTATTPKGATQQFVATATYLDASTGPVTTTADWTSAASGVASVGLNTGLATGVTANATPVVITAAFGGQTDTALMTVTNAALLSIAVSPATGATTPVGGTYPFVATGTYTDGTTPVVTTTAIWTSGAGATVDANGLATGVTANAAPEVITATIGSVFGTANLLVTPPPGPNLRRTASFAVLSTGSSITATGTTAVTGDVGATSFTGGGTLNITAGTNYSAGSGQPFVDAVADLPSVISDANDTTLFPCGSSIAPNLSGVVLTPGVTCINANAAILNTGVVTLNGSGVYIIRTTGALTPAASSSVAFGGTATNANTTVFWVVGAANIGSPSTWMGTILTGGAVVLGDTDTLVKGRVLTTAAVTLSNNTVTIP
jgi:hypothetical protein